MVGVGFTVLFDICCCGGYWYVEDFVEIGLAGIKSGSREEANCRTLDSAMV